MRDNKNLYQELVSDYQNQVTKLESIIKTVSVIRLVIFFLLVFIIYKALVSESVYYWLAFAINIISFLILLKYHSKLYNKKAFIDNLILINKEELKAIGGDNSAFGNGKDYEISGHDFSLDLDVFGNESLFQKTDRTSTIKGSQVLGKWFNNPSLNKEEIEKRQSAAQELTPLITFRQFFRARGMATKEVISEINFLEKWFETENIFFPKLIFRLLTIIFPLLNIIGIVLFSFDILPGKILVLLLLLSLGIVGVFIKKINLIHQNLSKRTALLEKYIHILKIIENQDFKSDLLQETKIKIGKNKDLASESIKELSQILSALDTRLNVFAGILLNAVLLWDIQQVRRLEKWKSKHAIELKQWFEAIAEIDALCSISNLSFNNPKWTFPMVNSNNIWAFNNIRHPLMRTEVCIANDFNVDKIPHLKVITGANMAGKSTYLRTIGSNMILAMIGAPVHADKMNFTPINIISSLRTTDSLMKNESYFYAEIKRLQIIVNRLKNGEHLFVLLDEILKGTNSKDKEQGSKALLRQLINYKTVGIIATHDLSLGKLEQEFSPNIKNQCFEVDINGDELSFDYKIRFGVAKNMNASFLLKKMGIV